MFIKWPWSKVRVTYTWFSGVQCSSAIPCSRVYFPLSTWGAAPNPATGLHWSTGPLGCSLMNNSEKPMNRLIKMKRLSQFFSTGFVTKTFNSQLTFNDCKSCKLLRSRAISVFLHIPNRCALVFPYMDTKRGNTDKFVSSITVRPNLRFKISQLIIWSNYCIF